MQGLKNRLKLRYWISVKSVLATTCSFLKIRNKISISATSLGLARITNDEAKAY